MHHFSGNDYCLFSWDGAHTMDYNVRGNNTYNHVSMHHIRYYVPFQIYLPVSVTFRSFSNTNTCFGHVSRLYMYSLQLKVRGFSNTITYLDFGHVSSLFFA